MLLVFLYSDPSSASFALQSIHINMAVYYFGSAVKACVSLPLAAHWITSFSSDIHHSLNILGWFKYSPTEFHFNCYYYFNLTCTFENFGNSSTTIAFVNRWSRLRGKPLPLLQCRKKFSSANIDSKDLCLYSCYWDIFLFPTLFTCKVNAFPWKCAKSLDSTICFSTQCNL